MATGDPVCLKVCLHQMMPAIPQGPQALGLAVRLYQLHSVAKKRSTYIINQTVLYLVIRVHVLMCALPGLARVCALCRRNCIVI